MIKAHIPAVPRKLEPLNVSDTNLSLMKWRPQDKGHILQVNGGNKSERVYA